MKSKLYVKFIVCYVILGILGFFVIATLGSNLVEQTLIRQNADALYREATSIASTQAASYYQRQSSIEEIYENLSALSKYQDAEIWMINPSGFILINTSQELDIDQPEHMENFDPAAFAPSYYSIGRFYNQFNYDHLSVMVPITLNLSTKGYISIHRTLDSIYYEREQLLGSMYTVFFVFFIMSLLILGCFTFIVYLPLKKITYGANEYAAGNLKHNIPVESDDEMGYLAATLNYMSDDLDNFGEYQREFVSNVSHDFRSPLTSIKGYIEAILDGTIPTEMQEKYLNIVLLETERLNKLTQSLLTLDNFNIQESLLHISDFEINQMIKDTAESFGGSCIKKRITIELHLTAEDLYVSADMGKIQQVLYNLIDNAIKFSPVESIITVEATEKHGKIFVSVKDSGSGIPKESIGKIWDRFYKSDSSRGKDRKGTGLGLAIVKEIINAHSQNINVISTEGVGSEFIFTLDKAKHQQQKGI